MEEILEKLENIEKRLINIEQKLNIKCNLCGVNESRYIVDIDNTKWELCEKCFKLISTCPFRRVKLIESKVNR